MSPHTSAAGRRRRDDSGQVMVWMLGCALVTLLLAFGASTETWRVISGWRALAAAADAAAVAGASGIDEATFRASGGQVIQLDPDRAEDLAYRSLDAQADDIDITSAEVTATPEGVTVTVHGQVDLLVLDTIRGEPFAYSATASADPRPST